MEDGGYYIVATLCILKKRSTKKKQKNKRFMPKVPDLMQMDNDEEKGLSTAMEDRQLTLLPTRVSGHYKGRYANSDICFTKRIMHMEEKKTPDIRDVV